MAQADGVGQDVGRGPDGFWGDAQALIADLQGDGGGALDEQLAIDPAHEVVTRPFLQKLVGVFAALGRIVTEQACQGHALQQIATGAKQYALLAHHGWPPGAPGLAAGAKREKRYPVAQQPAGAHTAACGLAQAHQLDGAQAHDVLNLAIELVGRFGLGEGFLHPVDGAGAGALMHLILVVYGPYTTKSLAIAYSDQDLADGLTRAILSIPSQPKSLPFICSCYLSVLGRHGMRLLR